MVSMESTPQNSLSSKAAMVTTIIAMSEPGIFLLILGMRVMMTMLSSPIAVLHRSMLPMFWK